MDAYHILSARHISVLLLSGTLLVAGCRSATPTTEDTSLKAHVQERLGSDQNLSGQAIQASVDAGIVTLTGSVTSETARTIASGDAAQVPGVKTVVDNLVVQPGSAGAAPSQQPAKPSPMLAARMPAQQAPPPAAPIERSQPAINVPPQPAPAVSVGQAPPPPPPASAVHPITLPAGTDIPVRITQTLDSATAQAGDKFTGAVASDIIDDGVVVLPRGTPVTGHVDAAQDAAHFKGSSLLTISLTAIDHRGQHILCATEGYTRQGQGRGKNTAEKVGGGAAVGAILGGILGHGAGAAIGAAAGAGAGAGVNGVTRGQQVQIESETVVRFKLSGPIVLHVNTGAGPPQASGPTLEHRNQ